MTSVIEAQFDFDSPVTAADFTPAWFSDDDEGSTGLTVTQNGPSSLLVTFPPLIASGEAWSLTNQPSYVASGQSGLFA